MVWYVHIASAGSANLSTLPTNIAIGTELMLLIGIKSVVLLLPISKKVW